MAILQHGETASGMAWRCGRCSAVKATPRRWRGLLRTTGGGGSIHHLAISYCGTVEPSLAGGLALWALSGLLDHNMARALLYRSGSYG